MNTQKAKWLKKLCAELRISNYKRVKKMYMDSPQDKKENFEQFLRDVMYVKTKSIPTSRETGNPFGAVKGLQDIAQSTSTSPYKQGVENTTTSTNSNNEGTV